MIHVHLPCTVHMCNGVRVGIIVSATYSLVVEPFDDVASELMHHFFVQYSDMFMCTLYLYMYMFIHLPLESYHLCDLNAPKYSTGALGQVMRDHIQVLCIVWGIPVCVCVRVRACVGACVRACVRMERRLFHNY